MHRFHVAIHAAPPVMPATRLAHLSGRAIHVLPLEPGDLRGSIPCSFEQALDALNELPRMFVELDGSFVWVAPGGPAAWQVDGLLFDRAGQLTYIELKGGCPPAQLDQLLAVLGWPGVALVFQLVREAVFLDEPGFRAWSLDASADAPPC